MKTTCALVAAVMLVGAASSAQAGNLLDKLDRLNQPDAPAQAQSRQKVQQPVPMPTSSPAETTKLTLEPSTPTQGRSLEQIRKEQADLDKELSDLLKK